MSVKFQVQKEGKLLDFLFQNLDGWAKKTVKQYLKNSNIFVNGASTTKHDFNLVSGDIVEVGAMTKAKPIKELEIIYQDKYLVAINKPSGLLSVSTAHENKDHALSILRAQLSRGRKNAIRLWPVHRLDRDTSGVLLFATSKEMREKVMDKWSESEKTYLAIVQGCPQDSHGTINQPLRMDETDYLMHVGAHYKAKNAITHYKVKETSKQRSLLEVKIDTGIQHQIRAHLAWLGHSIIGDERYGKKGIRMGLHSKKLVIIHPINQKRLAFKVDASRDFYDLL